MVKSCWIPRTSQARRNIMLVNWEPLLVTILNGAPYLPTQVLRKASRTVAVSISGNGAASTQREHLSRHVSRYLNLPPASGRGPTKSQCIVVKRQAGTRIAAGGGCRCLTVLDLEHCKQLQQ